MMEFEEWLDQETALLRAELRDGLPDWPWMLGPVFCGYLIPAWDEAVNPA